MAIGFYNRKSLFKLFFEPSGCEKRLCGKTRRNMMVDYFQIYYDLYLLFFVTLHRRFETETKIKEIKK